MISQGQVPAELLHQLKQGPAKHVKNHSYDYRKKIDAEIVKIGRIQGFRQWIIAQSIVAIGSVGIGLTPLSRASCSFRSTRRVLLSVVSLVRLSASEIMAKV